MSHSEREVLKTVTSEHLQKLQIGAASILNVVRKSLLHVAYVAGFEIQGTSPTAGGKNGHSPFTRHVVLPFIGIGMPMQLAQTTRMNGHDRCRNCGRYLEGAGVHDARLATLGAVRNCRLIRAKCEIVRRHTEGPCRFALIICERPRRFSLKNEKLFPGQIFKSLAGNAKILGKHLSRRMRYPVAEQNRLVFRKVAIIEDQQKLGSVGP